MNYDVIIPVAYKDYSFLKKSWKYLCDNLGADRIFILTEGCMIRFLPSIIRNNPTFIILDENSLLEGLTFSNVASILQSLGRKNTYPGWYYQQFLKMGFALSKYCTNEYYLSWDADTIPVRSINFFNETGHPFFSMKSEYYPPYFLTMQSLIGLGKINSKSYIAEHMMFNRDMMRSLIERIESANTVPGEKWFEKILNAIPPESVGVNTYSEFETYGSFCKEFNQNLYVERQINSFRLGGLIQGRFVSKRILTTFASYDFDVVSFEVYHYPPFPWGPICKWYEKKYVKFKGRILKKIVSMCTNNL